MQQQSTTKFLSTPDQNKLVLVCFGTRHPGRLLGCHISGYGVLLGRALKRWFGTC